MTNAKSTESGQFDGFPPSGSMLCPRCDYSLEGLPSEYACPECGFKFDSAATLWKANVLKPFKWLDVAIVGGVLFSFLLVLATAIMNNWMQYPAVAIMMAVLAYLIWSEYGITRHVLFSTHGIHRRVGSNWQKLINWEDVLTVDILLHIRRNQLKIRSANNQVIQVALWNLSSHELKTLIDAIDCYRGNDESPIFPVTVDGKPLLQTNRNQFTGFPPDGAMNCPRCNKSLANQPIASECIECGQPYDEDTFLLRVPKSENLSWKDALAWIGLMTLPAFLIEPINLGSAILAALFLALCFYQISRFDSASIFAVADEGLLQRKKNGEIEIIAWSTINQATLLQRPRSLQIAFRIGQKNPFFAYLPTPSEYYRKKLADVLRRHLPADKVIEK